MMVFGDASVFAGALVSLRVLYDCTCLLACSECYWYAREVGAIYYY